MNGARSIEAAQQRDEADEAGLRMELRSLSLCSTDMLEGT